MSKKKKGKKIIRILFNGMKVSCPIVNSHKFRKLGGRYARKKCGKIRLKINMKYSVIDMMTINLMRVFFENIMISKHF